MWLISLWGVGLLAVAIYCIWQAIRDYRRGDYAMAAAGAAGAALIVLMPVQQHAVKVEMPVQVPS